MKKNTEITVLSETVKNQSGSKAFVMTPSKCPFEVQTERKEGAA